jgi:hypothetical protein
MMLCAMHCVCRPCLPALAPALASFHCARPEHDPGKNQKNKTRRKQFWNGLLRWQRAPGFGEPSLIVKRKVKHQPSSLERGSAATRTVVRSISLLSGANELTHISRINRR